MGEREAELQHWTAWEDAGMVGVVCSRAPLDRYGKRKTWTLDQEDRSTAKCPHCSRLVKLHWSVRLETLATPWGSTTE